MPEEEKVPEQPRVAVPELEVEQRRACFAEVVLGYTAEAARAEASRCLKCHLAAKAAREEAKVG